jgi:hypothetical protein
MTQSELTISSILLELAAEYNSVVAERELFERVLERRPSQAKDPYASIRNVLRYEGSEAGWVRLGSGKAMPRHVALQNLRFRIIPTDDEFAGDMISRVWLVPFITPRTPTTDIKLQRSDDKPIATSVQRPDGVSNPRAFITFDALKLGDWFKRTGFDPGDSILVTITSIDPFTLRLEREPAADFRADAVAERDQQVVDEIAAQVAKARSNMLFPEEVVLPIYARAAWRSEYPGRPWQQLVANDQRLQLMDEMFIAARSYRRPFDTLFGNPRDEEIWDELDKELLTTINAFQAELLASRRDAAERGLWNGIAPRASTGQVIYDMREGTSQVVHPGIVNALDDHAADIEERVERGDFADEGWDDELDTEEMVELGFDPDFDADELLAVDDIDDMQAFMDQNPALIEATQKLMASLSPTEIEALQAAETPDQVHKILTGHLNELLGKNPGLFAELAPPLTVEENSNGNGNGHGEPVTIDLLRIEGDEQWDDEDEDDEWDDEDEDDEDLAARSQVVERSNELMERFYQSQVASGKSETTAASRTGDLWIYGDFLASYYNRALDQGDYATLDECLFFYYPRKVLNNSPRAAREMCTSIKQFYAFLRAEDIVADDSFAQAMWRRRDQAARAIELYDQIDGDSPQFERLFAHLFAPYTA